MSLEKPKIENNEFIIEDIMLFSAFTDAILIGYMIFSTILFLFLLKYLWNGFLIFSIFSCSLLAILISSIKTTLKLTGVKRVKFLTKGLQLEYLKWNKVFIKKFIKWENISGCELNNGTNSGNRIRRHQLLLKLGTKTISLGENISDSQALIIRDTIQSKLNSTIEKII